MGVAIDLIEPMGFAWDDKRVRRTAMDYIDHVDVTRHSSFDEFRGANPGRLILFSTKGTASPYEFALPARRHPCCSARKAAESRLRWRPLPMRC